MNKIILIGIGIGIIVIVTVVVGNNLVQNQIEFIKTGSETVIQPTKVKVHDVPEGLTSVTISGKIKSYAPPSGAPKSDVEPEFVLVTDKDYPELPGVISIELYNVMQLPENLEHVQVTGFFNPKNPDWYYPEQKQRTQQVIFVEEVIQLEPIDLGNEYTTQELRDKYDVIQNTYKSLKEQYSTNEISIEEYLVDLEKLAESELELYEDVKEHTFDRDEMTEYNFWYRGVMKFPTAIEQEISNIDKQ